MKTTLTILFTFLAFTLQAQVVTVNTFANSTHLGGSLTVEETHTFPADVSGFSQVLMHVALTCPAVGCDPWDRYAHILIEHEGEEYEIGRYITPYGNGWCDWTLDVTPYREMLTGEVKMISYIETWQNGWDLTVDFDFVTGVPEYTHTKVTNLYIDYDKRYGDTIAFVNDIDAVEAMIADNAEKVVFRANITGHGQGNTENAAEFSPKTHKVNVDGSDAHDHYLWKDDCNVNPCSPQAGTWQFARAGWCPGQEVAPNDFEITTLVTPGSPALFDYRLDSYYNLCSPWNPDCVNGVTCADCIYNSSGHTEPHYKMALQLIQYSNTAFPVGLEEPGFEGHLSIWPNPANGLFSLNAELPSAATTAFITDIAGEVVKQLEFPNSIIQTKIDCRDLAPGVYHLILQGNDYSVNRKLLIQ